MILTFRSGYVKLIVIDFANDLQNGGSIYAFGIQNKEL